jgi:DNA polymerase III subunit beta
MKFRVERDALAEAVAWVARALPSRPVLPVLAGLLVQAGDGLTLSCFDYEVSARVRIEAEVEEAGNVLVPGRLLAEIARSLPEAPAEFSSDADMVALNCGSAEFTLVCLPLEDYPAAPQPPPAVGTVDGGALAVAAAQVVPAASRDDTLPMLTAVCLDVHGETLTLAATDRYRLAVRDLRWEPADAGSRAAAMIPARILADAARSMTTGVPVTVAFGAVDGTGRTASSGPGPRPGEGMISFEYGSRRLSARLISGEYLTYQTRFPAEFGCRAEVPAGPFTEAVKRVSLVAERASPVRLTFGPGTVVIEAQAPGRARAVETVSADFAGDEPVICFCPGYLLDGLGAAAATAPGEPGRIRLEFSTPAKPAMITWADAEASTADGGGGTESQGFRYLLVPLRVTGSWPGRSSRAPEPAPE